MNGAAASAGYIARLLSQLLREPDNQAALESTLRSLEATNGSAVTLTWDNWRLRLNGKLLPPGIPGLQELLARMAAHEIRVMSFEAGTAASHFLGAVGILAGDPVIGDGGVHAMARLGVLAAESITFVPVVASSVPVPTTDGERQREGLPPVPNMDEFELADIEIGAPAAPNAPVAVKRRPSSELYVAPNVAAESAEGLVARLAAASAPGEVSAVLDAMGTLSDRSSGDVANVLTMLLAIIAQEPRFKDADAQRAFRFVYKRMATPSLFQRLAESLPTARERYRDYVAVLRQGGDNAVDALIDALVNAESAKERRVLFDALVELRRGVQTLIYMLGDRRWYVARNAAELLGEMRATEAEQPLIEVLRYDDPRVRRSAAVALARLGTPAAIAALSSAMQDPSVDVRMQATMAMTVHPAAATLPTVIKALTDEQDSGVQRTLLVALGKIATPEAVRRLIAAAEPERGLFKRKSLVLRLAAVEVLGDVRTPEAAAAIQALTKDREAQVREAALAALAASEGAKPPKRVTDAGW